MKNDRSLKIYKPQEIEGLQNIEKFKIKTQEDCTELMLQTRKTCEELKKNAIDAGLKELRDEQLNLFQQSQKKISNFFETTQNELNSILTNVVEKLKMNETNSKLLSNLLNNEIEKLKMRSNKLTIYANAKTLPQIKEHIAQEYTSRDNISFDFDVKDDLKFDECYLESPYVIVRINISDFQNAILNIIQDQPLNL